MSKKRSGFGPISHHSARVLVLGSMPGERSLSAGEYYAHPQNSFWKIMERITGLDAKGAYDQRIESLKAARIALWDVLKNCERKSSLDSDIQTDSITVNKFRAFFSKHPEIELICFNGTFAEQSFNKYVLPSLQCATMRYVRLPSTSPAHTLAFEKKAEAWSVALSVASGVGG